ASHVGDILSEYLAALEVQAGQRLIGVILGDKGLASGGETLEILRRPPVPELACRIEGGAQIVEAVADFVADSGADPAIVGRPTAVGIVIGLFEDRRREIERILQR